VSKWFVNPLVASRLIILFLLTTGTSFGYATGILPPIPDVSLPILYPLARWDSGYYLGIAEKGFGTFPDSKGYVFRPLFPLVLRAVSLPFFWMDVRSAEVLGGFVWNLVALVVAGFYLEKLTRMLWGQTIANRSLLLLAIYPSTFFFSAIYPEATCILLIAASLYYLESGRLFLSSGLGFLAGLTRPEAFLLAIPFLVKALFEDKKIEKLIGGIAVLSSVPTFAIFGYLQTGNIFASLQAEQAWPKCTILCFVSNPVFRAAPSILPYAINFVTMTMAVIFIAYPLVLGKSSTKIFPYYLWALVLLATMFYVGEIRSWARFSLVVPPVFWAQAEYSLGRPRFFYALIASYSTMMAVAAILFVNWYPML
jgi:mannosyltransferase PIG-V